MPRKRSNPLLPRVFLLSPAQCSGKRAQVLCRPQAEFELASRLRREGAPLGEVFSFLSGLYFRGKLAYASTFGAAAQETMVITPSDGLRPPETIVTLADLARFAETPIHLDEPRYRDPLARDCEQLARRLAKDAEVVFLGSLATRKYLDILEPVFGSGLRFPEEFFGRGDMSRGALLLRAARVGAELRYVSTSAHRSA